MKITVESTNGTDIKLGTLFKWVNCNKNNICMLFYGGAVSLNCPILTWDWENPVGALKDLYKKGAIELLSIGTKVILEQE